jgi:hypothetical protein
MAQAAMSTASKGQRKAKFKVGQVVVTRSHFGFHVVDHVWAKNMPEGFAEGEPLYQLHANGILLEIGTLMFRQSELRPLTRREAGQPRR